MHLQIALRGYCMGELRVLKTGLGVIAAGVIAALALAVAPALGQSTFGSVLGSVHDPSGALISNCLIAVANKGTSAKRTTLTDQTGSYSLPNLEPGDYAVTMQAQGFQIATYNIQLTARQTFRLDSQLSVASTNSIGERDIRGGPDHQH